MKKYELSHLNSMSVSDKHLDSLVHLYFPDVVRKLLMDGCGVVMFEFHVKESELLYREMTHLV